MEITCNPTGAPKPSIQWRNVNKDQEITTGGRFTILPSGNLKIKNVQKADEGRYSCTVSNKLGKQSKEGKLSVRGMLIIFLWILNGLVSCLICFVDLFPTSYCYYQRATHMAFLESIKYVSYN